MGKLNQLADCSAISWKNLTQKKLTKKKFTKKNSKKNSKKFSVTVFFNFFLAIMVPRPLYACDNLGGPK
jgi:hypothetical protein